MTNPWEFPVITFLLAVYFLYLACFCWMSWRDFVLAAPGRHFNFRITDIWAAMIGLTPSLLLAAHVSNASLPKWELYALFLLLPAQLAWIFKGRLFAEQNELWLGYGHNAVTSAVQIIGGALFAIPFTLFAVLALTIGFPALVLYAMLYLRREAQQQ